MMYRFCCGLLLCLLTAPLVHAESDVTSHLQQASDRFASYTLRGTLTYERFLPAGSRTKEEYRIEYRFLNGSQRLTFTPTHLDTAPEAVFVSTKELSFQVFKHPDGLEEIRYLSPRRGAGRKQVSSAIDVTAGILCRLAWQFAGQTYLDLLQNNHLIWERVEGATTPDGTAEFRVTRLAPPLFSESSDNFESLIGTLRFRTQPYWAVETIDLQYRFKDTEEPVPGLHAALSFTSKSEGDTVLDSVRWELLNPEGVSDRYDLTVDDMAFGAPQPDDFTLAGCGVTTVDTAGVYSPLPLLARYGIGVTIFCLIGLWLVKRHQRDHT